MKCPVCECETGKTQLECPECAHSFDRGAVEEYHHLHYLLAWLNEETESLEPAIRQKLGAQAEKRLENVVRLLNLAELTTPPEPVGPVPESVLQDHARELALLEGLLLELSEWRNAGEIGDRYLTIILKPVRSRIAELEQAIGGAGVQVAQPSRVDTLRYIAERLPRWAEAGWLSNRPAQTLTDIVKKRQDMLLRAREEPASAPTAAPPAPVKPAPVAAVKSASVIPAPKAKSPPKPREPVINWSKVKQKVSDAAASGMLLNVLLYLGAFMIVISTGILVVRFWESFPQILQLAVIAAVPATFYLLGWIGRAKLKLPQAGRVLTYIGALLVAVDFAAIYQFGGLSERVDLSMYWFVASLVCTLIYALSAWRLPTEFIGYITFLGLASMLASLSAWIGLAAEWQVASAAFAALATLAISKRLKQAPERWAGPALAGQILPIFLLPIAQIAVLFAPGRLAWGQMATFALASVGYAALGWRFSFRPRWRAIFTQTAVWSSVGAILFTMLAIRLPGRWYATAAAVAALLYIVAGRQLGQRLPEDFRRRRLCLAAFYGAGFGLLALAVLASFGMLAGELFGPTANFWAALLALTMAAMVLAACATLFQNPWFLLAGGGLFIAPFSIAVTRWMIDADLRQWAPWLMTAWSALAISYMALARFLPVDPRFGMTLNFWAHGLQPLAALGLLINYSVSPADWFAGPTLIALASIMIVYALSTVVHDEAGHPSLSRLVAWLPEPPRKAIFLWPLGFLLPVWLAVAWLGNVLPLAWLGSILAGLALIYVGLGQFIFSRRPAYRLPLHSYAYALPVVGVGLALGHSWPLLLTLLLSVAVLVALAFVYRRVVEVGAAAVLFVWPFHLALTMTPITHHAYALAYALLASLAYVPLGQALHPKGSRVPWKADPDTWPAPKTVPYALVLYILGYALAVGAVAISLAGRVDIFATDVPWVGVIVPVIVCGLMLFSQYRFRGYPFAWPAVLMLIVAYGQTLTWLHLPGFFVASAWVSLAIVCMLAERGLKQWLGASWLATLRRPFWVTAIALCLLGLLLTAGETIVALSGRPIEQVGPIILAQSLAVLLATLAAVLYRSRWPLYLEPPLIFLPVTLFFVGFGSRLFGQPLATVHYSLIWIGLALPHLIAAAILDRMPVRYAQGLYLGGYAITVLALAWSAPDRFVNTIVLVLTLLIAVGSQVIIHFGKHRTHDDLMALLRLRSGTIIWRAARTFFLFVAVYGFPVWLAQLLTYHQVGLAWRGFTFALLAPIYVALGLALGRVRAEYTWPLYSAGYALTAIGAMIAIDDQSLFITVLGLNTLVYTASAYIFRQPYWLYLSKTLIPVIALLILDYSEQLAPAWIAGIFMALAYAYIAIGWLLNRRLAPGNDLAPFALPFFSLGYLISAISLAAGSSERMLAIAVFTAGVLLYSASARLLRESLFLYPAAWLAAVPYYLVMTLTGIPEGWYGVGLLPLTLAYIGIGRFVFGGVEFSMKGWPAVRSAHGRPAMPFYLLAYACTLWAVVSSLSDAVALTVALAAVSAIYYGSAALFRSFIWLYPGLLATHAVILAYVSIDPGDGAIQYLSIPFLILTWLLAFFGLGFMQRFPAERSIDFEPRQYKIGRWQLTMGGWPSIRHLLSPSWSQPFFIFVLLDVVIWQLVALGGYDTALLLAGSNLLLFAYLATLWQDTALPYAALLHAVLAIVVGFAWAGLSAPDSLALMGAVGLVMYGLARLIDLAQRRLPRFALWIQPLERAAVPLSIVAVIGTLPTVALHGQSTASALGFAGTLYLAIAYRGRYQQLGYMAVAMLELAWILLLLGQDIGQPQFYAVPIGLYFVGIGVLERRQGNIRYANLLEGFGLAAVLLTTFIQSLAPSGGFIYFLLLLVESLLFAAWGVIRNVKVPFFAGLAATFLNIIAQLVLVATVNDLWRWIIVLGTGVLVISLGIFIERKREQITNQIHEWQVELSTWS